MENNVCQNCKKTFLPTPDELEFYKKIQVPEPTFCSLCRFQRRFMRRNERMLYSRTCSGSGKRIVSYFDDKVTFPVYSREYWYGDAWDGADYGREYDFSKPFFEQFIELAKVAPRIQLWIINSTDSDYSNYCIDSKNCYLCFWAAGGNEDCMYSSYLVESLNCVDCDQINKCDRCYECFNCDTSYNCRYCVDSTNCRDAWFLADCYNCSDCFGCVGLKDQQYCLYNVQYSKEDYRKKIEELKLTERLNVSEFIALVAKLWDVFPKRYMHGRKTEDSSGDYATNSSNCKDVFCITDCEDSSHLFATTGLTTCMDITASVKGGELMYECHAVPKQNYNLRFCDLCSNGCTNLEYCSNCDSSSNLFGCIGMRKKEYCIFNKQYTKEEYEELVPKIRAHMNSMPLTDSGGRVYKYGEFFPPEASPFSYNETLAQEFFPLSKEDAEIQGFVWRELKEKNYGITVKPADVPKTGEIPDGIVKEIIGCANEGKGNHNCATAFRITQNELLFYRQNKLPLPTHCPNCRHHFRLQYRNNLGLRKRVCDCAGTSSTNGKHLNQGRHIHGSNPCGIEFETTYADSEKIVYCEGCYQQEVA